MHDAHSGHDVDGLELPNPFVIAGLITQGGYSSKAVKPIALRMLMEIATIIRSDFPGRSLSGIARLRMAGRRRSSFC